MARISRTTTTTTFDGTVEEVARLIQLERKGEHRPHPPAPALLSLPAPSGSRPEDKPARRGPLLTLRELEVARLIVKGLVTREIAERMVITIATVKTHRRGISRKLGGTDKALLVAKQAFWERD